jgi:quercetin dioxygenase-like cupin family protein
MTGARETQGKDVNASPNTNEAHMANEEEPSADVINVRPLEVQLGKARTTTLVKTDRMEILRLIVHAGREIPFHLAPGDLIVQCLEGEVTFASPGKTSKLQPGELIYHPARIPHALAAKYDSSLLVTILFVPP